MLQNNPHVDVIRVVKEEFLKTTGYRYLWRYPADLVSTLTDKKKRYYRLYFQYVPPSWLYEKPIKEIVPEIFSELGIKPDCMKVQLFFTKKEEDRARRMLAPYKDVILLHIHSRSSTKHHWPMENWEQLVRSMPDYTFIQVGLADEPSVKGALDWRGKTGVREAYCLLKYSLTFVGIDSSFAHATNAFDLPGVVLWGDTSPVHWGHENNINLFKKVPCSPCYYYLYDNPCPFDHECMRSITVEEVRNALLRQIVPGKKRLTFLGYTSPVY